MDAAQAHQLKMEADARREAVEREQKHQTDAASAVAVGRVQLEEA